MILAFDQLHPYTFVLVFTGNMSLYNTYSDGELVSFLQQGDQLAFTALYDRYWDKLYFLAGQKLKDLFEAEHMVQDVFMDLWKRRHSLNIEIVHSLEGYLVVAVKYRILNLLAKKAREADLQKQVALQSAVADDTTETWMDFKELHQRYHEQLAALPPQCALAFALRDEGLTYREIADTMDIAPKTVEMHIGRALKTLRTRLGSFFSFLF